MNEEIAFHLESYQADLIAQGIDPAEARRRARLEFGSSSAAVEERCRDAYGLRLWDDFIADLRYALRQFRHAPGFTVTVIIVLALGIGANATMFTVISQTLLRRLPYGHADEIVALTAVDREGKYAGALDTDLIVWKTSHALRELLQWRNIGLTWLHYGTSLEQVERTLTGPGLCGFLQVKPFLGRCFTSSDVRSGPGNVLLLNYTLWQKAFGSNRNVLGKTARIDDKLYTIIGVMPEGFAFTPHGFPLQVWTPVPLDGTLEAGQPPSSDAMARLQPGISLEQVAAELSAKQYVLARQHVAKTSLDIAAVQVKARSLRSTLYEEDRPALLAFLAAVLTLWLIACLNVSNLLLARGVSRQRELGIRSALGAGRSRIVRQLLIESFLLSASGTAAGLVLAESVLLTFAHLLHTRLQLPDHPVPDARVLSALVAFSLLSALLFGLAPALLATRTIREQSLHRQSSSSPGRGHLRLQHALVSAEVACTVVLLVVCGLLLRTVLALRKVPLGFRIDHVALVHPQFPGYTYKDKDMQHALYGPLIERIRAVHGVQSAALTTVAPLNKEFSMMLYMSYGDTDTGPDSHTLATQLHADGRDLQKVLGFRMRQGRYFNASDTRTSQPVAVVNQTFVNLWSKSGKSLDEFPLSLAKDKKRKIRIIGVIDDVRQISLAEPPAPEIDLCAEQLLPTDNFYQPTMRTYAEIAIRTAVPIEQIAPDIRAAMAAVDPALKGSVVEAMQQVVNDNIGDQLFAAHLLETFGGCALLVALTGLYGFLAYLVSQRTHDIGVRLALGAQPAAIQWMFLARALAMIAAGLAAGVLVSLFATRLVTRFLYGVRPNDLTTLFGVVLVILTASLVAAWLPARRASNVEPMEALREA
jgi:predicted permease